jgi:hypothetical protein
MSSLAVVETGSLNTPQRRDGSQRGVEPQPKPGIRARNDLAPLRCVQSASPLCARPVSAVCPSRLAHFVRPERCSSDIPASHPRRFSRGGLAWPVSVRLEALFRPENRAQAAKSRHAEALSHLTAAPYFGGTRHHVSRSHARATVILEKASTASTVGEQQLVSICSCAGDQSPLVRYR